MEKKLLLFILNISLVSASIIAQNPVEIFGKSNMLIAGKTTSASSYDVNAVTPDTIHSAIIPGYAQVPGNNRLSPLNAGSELKAFDFSAAYPNPASVSTSLEYNIPSGSYGKIMLRNLLGKVVREINLDKTEGRVVISTNDLKDGLYFYSALLNNKVELTRKLVIKH